MNHLIKDVLEYFKEETKNHRMTVLRDDGLYRHLRFSNAGRYAYRFDFVTWPGYLCVSGDMGHFLFRRIEDMFEFFRQPYSDDMKIDLRYWAEKARAVDASGGVEQYDPNVFTKHLREFFDDFACELEDGEKEALWERIDDEVLSYAQDSEYQAREAAMDFEYDRRRILQGLASESRFNSYTHQYIWICIAIVWGINVYDGTIVPGN